MTGYDPNTTLRSEGPLSVSAPVSHYSQSHDQYGQSYPFVSRGAWTTGLCSCCDDCYSCCIGCWCPCVLVGKSVETLEEGKTSSGVAGSIFFLLQALFGCGCLYTWIYRARLRHRYGLPETPCSDLCTDCCCLGCSICQVYRELENRRVPSTAFGAAPSAPDFQFMTK